MFQRDKASTILEAYILLERGEIKKHTHMYIYKNRYNKDHTRDFIPENWGAEKLSDFLKVQTSSRNLPFLPAFPQKSVFSWSLPSFMLFQLLMVLGTDTMTLAIL